MTAIDPRPGTDLRSHATPRTDPDPSPAWFRTLAWLAAIVAASDVLFFVLIATVVPPLAVAALLTVVGLVLLRRRPGIALGMLGGTSLLMLVGNLPFAIDHLAHPASAIDFVHAVIGTVGRALVLVAVVGAWRRASAGGARRLAVAAVGLGAAAVVTAGVAMVATTAPEAGADDVAVTVERAAFPEVVEIASGEVLFVDNRDLFRHTFTVEGTDIDTELPATGSARVPVDLAPGSYDVICAVPGHESMTATLEVR